MLLCEPHKSVMRNSSSSDKDHSVCLVIGFDIVFQVLPLDGEDVFLWPEDGSSERLTLEGSSMQMVKDDFLNLFLNFFHFAKDDISLPLDGLLLKFGVLEDIGKDLHGLGGIVLKASSEVDCIFTLFIA